MVYISNQYINKSIGNTDTNTSFQKVLQYSGNTRKVLAMPAIAIQYCNINSANNAFASLRFDRLRHAIYIAMAYPLWSKCSNCFLVAATQRGFLILARPHIANVASEKIFGPFVLFHFISFFLKGIEDTTSLPHRLRHFHGCRSHFYKMCKYSIIIGRLRCSQKRSVKHKCIQYRCQ